MYVEYILFVLPTEILLQQTLEELNSCLILKRIEPIDAYLGVQIVYNPETRKLFLHQ